MVVPYYFGECMRRIIGVFLVLILSGCANINIPNYIQDKHPRHQTFYAAYDQVYDATTKALDDLGWVIEAESDPALFERERESQGSSRQQILIFTDIHQFPFFVGSKYSRLNVFLQITADKAIEVEIRYIKVTSLLFKTFSNYKNDRLTDRLFKHIEKNLNL